MKLIRILCKILVAVVGCLLAVVLLSLGYLTFDGWMQEREWTRSKERIPHSEVEIYGVKLERLAEDPTEATFSGFIRNRSAKYVLAGVNVQVIFKQCDRSAEPPVCIDLRPWTRNSLGVLYRTKPGGVAEFRYSAHVGDPPTTLKGELVADIVITSVRGLEP